MQSGGDVSPSTKRRNSGNPQMVSAGGEACAWLRPDLHLSLPLPCGSPGGAAEAWGSPRSPRIPAHPRNRILCCRGRVLRGEQEQDGGGLPRLRAQQSIGGGKGKGK